MNGVKVESFAQNDKLLSVEISRNGQVGKMVVEALLTVGLPGQQTEGAQ